MNVKELHKTVLELREICESAGAAKMASDLNDLCEIFNGHDDQSVDEFLAHLRRLYGARSGGRSAEVAVDTDVVDRYLRRLREIGTDAVEFTRLIEEMRSERSIGPKEANAIQHAYIGGREAWPSKKAAIDAVAKWFEGSRYQDAVLEDIKSVTPW